MSQCRLISRQINGRTKNANTGTDILGGEGHAKYTQPLFYAIFLSLTLTSLVNLHLLICALSFRFNTICIYLSFVFPYGNIFGLRPFFFFRNETGA